MTIYPTFASSDYLDLNPGYAYNTMFRGGTDVLSSLDAIDLDYLFDQLITVPLRAYVRESFPSSNSAYFETAAACDNHANELYVGAWCKFE
mgnify:CR=1 FL=1